MDAQSTTHPATSLHTASLERVRSLGAPGVLAGRVAVILGATGWIGRALSRHLLDAGSSVVIIARDLARLEQLESELDAGGRVLAVAADVTSQLEVDDARAAALEAFGRVDLVVVLSGAIMGSAFEDGVPADWAEMIDVNLRGLLHTTQTFTQPLLDAASSGTAADLVLLGAISEESHSPRFAVFNAVSAAIAQLGRTLRDEYGPRGMRVHVVAPGFHPSAGVDESPVRDPRQGRAHAPVTPKSIAAVIALAAALPPEANLAEVVLLPTGSR
ncbi:SDR family oxidoreductase [Protaetiibacter intestinalis]|uniref:SDR family NAD(P)-dependent oxidoreductase n=1 Tax=Protaetiibacter intestinalis TaxID=2419774 RepID=A0A387BA58_9MICO|nr:SDR family NAD(P)-dependent oxidoreductase [Protaetiibacter intestinalis]AYF98025.1 SDR family NAD(P)-dependent oxidoreductase [Protaetiibacter intestinalis]